MNFDAFVNDIVSNKWNVFGTEVYKDGKLIHEFGDTKDDIHEIYSATKTVLSIAVGIAYDRGLFDLQRCVLDYLPKKNVSKMSSKQKDIFEKITIERLLTMSVGDLPFRAEGDSWVDYALSCEISNPDDRTFNYSNISAYLVGVALEGALGSDVGKFIEDEIFEPLGITDFEYKRCPEGHFYGASGMKLTVNELSRIGLILYGNGVYDGKRILSEEYVKLATGIRQMNREGGYGYFIWKYRDGFSINGKWKQKCYILPQREMMIYYLSLIQDDSHDLLESMERNILGL